MKSSFASRKSATNLHYNGNLQVYGSRTALVPADSMYLTGKLATRTMSNIYSSNNNSPQSSMNYT
jgi:hypothetical protein